MKKPETWLCMKKQIFLNNVRGEGGETKKKTEKKGKREGMCCANIKTNCSSISGTFGLHSNLLNKADPD